MALPKINEIRQLSDVELADEIIATKRKLFDLRFQKATRKLEKEFHQFKHTRHRLGQLMTVLRERQIAETSQPQNTAQQSSEVLADMSSES